jgi:hypothetical protein
MTFSCNQITPTTGTGAIFAFKNAMVTASWIMVCSSDGDEPNLGDVLATSGSGTGGLGNEGAWFVLREPVGNREYCFQRSNVDDFWRIKYSVSGGFDYSTGMGNLAPTASDEIVRLGSGSYETPSFSKLFPNNGTYRWQWSISTTSPYGFYAFGFAKGGGTPTSVIIHDALQSNTYIPEDIDPFCQLIGYHTSYILDGAYMSCDNAEAWNPESPTVYAVTGWTKKGLTGAKYGYITCGRYLGKSYPLTPGEDTYTFGPESYHLQEIPMPIVYGRIILMGNSGPKGWSNSMRWRSGITNRETGDTLKVVKSDGTILYFINAKHVWIPWDGTKRTLK